jgi:hypothetical protein
MSALLLPGIGFPQRPAPAGETLGQKLMRIVNTQALPWVGSAEWDDSLSDHNLLAEPGNKSLAPQDVKHRFLIG